MRTIPELHVLEIDSVRHGRIGEIAAVFEAENLMHLPVAERHPDGGYVIRGLFSATELARRLGLPGGIPSAPRLRAPAPSVGRAGGAVRVSARAQPRWIAAADSAVGAALLALLAAASAPALAGETSANGEGSGVVVAKEVEAQDLVGRLGIDALFFEYGNSDSSNSDVDRYALEARWRWSRPVLEWGPARLSGYWSLRLGYWDNDSARRTNSGPDPPRILVLRRIGMNRRGRGR